MDLKFLLLTFINCLALVAGQVLWKVGLSGSKDFGWKLILDPFIVAGLLIYAATTILWLYILQNVQLSVLYPLNSVCYILAIFAGLIFFHEPLSIYKIVGCAVIIIGLYIMYGFN